MEDLKIVYAQSPLPTKVTKTIYLAGPTDRNLRPTAWRQKALEILRDLNFDGHVFVPEFEGGKWNGNRDAQFEWENQAMSRADAIVFWMARDLEKLPGFTTNIEWGLYVNSGKVVWGAPDGAPKIEWAERYAEKFGVSIVRDLKYAIRIAREHIIGEGAVREGEDVLIPILKWRAKPVYPKPDLTVDNVVFRGDDVLLIRRKKSPFRGQWALPGGYVNKDEEPIVAAVRELKEETNLVSDHPVLIGVYGKKDRDPRGWVVATAFMSEALTEVKAKAGDDAAEVTWMSIQEALTTDLAFDHSLILRDALLARRRNG